MSANAPLTDRELELLKGDDSMTRDDSMCRECRGNVVPDETGMVWCRWCSAMYETTTG